MPKINMATRGFFDPNTWTISYVVWDLNTRRAAIIDPVLDYNFKSGHTATASVDEILAYISVHNLTVDWILETHAHADHLSGAHHLQTQVGGRIAIGENIRTVQATFKKLYNLEREFLPDGSQFDHLFKDGETFNIGTIEATAMLVPGHTPADMAYLMNGAVFVGDTLFMPDVGSARADFPGGCPRQLYASMRRILELPAGTIMYVCHDYPPSTRAAQWQTTVAEQRARNIHVRDGVTEDEFVKMRTERDATLDVPTLILPAIQVNVRAGAMPPADDNGIAYLRIPINTLPLAENWSSNDLLLERLRLLHKELRRKCVTLKLLWQQQGCPNLNTALFFEADEIRGAYLLTKKQTPPTPPRLNEVQGLIAQLSGFLGRKSDGEPGIKTIWQGLQRVMTAAETLAALRDGFWMASCV